MRRLTVLPLFALLAVLAAGCSTNHPGPVDQTDLQAAESFPFFRLYYAGMKFENVPLTAADGPAGYVASVGSSVYYGDCDAGKGILHGGGCTLPLQITTVVYQVHDNQALGPQRNIVIRGVPAAVYDGGKQIELYTGKLAIDITADTPARALRAAALLRPINGPGVPYRELPAPDFCPGLYGSAPPYKVAREQDGRLDCVDASAQEGTSKALPIGTPPDAQPQPGS